MNLDQVEQILEKLQLRGHITSYEKNGEKVWQCTEKGYEFMGELIRQKIKSLGYKPTEKLDEIIVRAMKGDKKDLEKLMEIFF